MDVTPESPFETRAEEYDAWYDAHPATFESEVLALRAVLPPRRGRWVEVGVGTGRFAVRLGIGEGVEPAAAMAERAAARGVRVVRGVAEDLPFAAGCLDAVFYVTTLCFVADLARTLSEARRVLAPSGHVVAAILPRDRPLGQRVAGDSSDPFFRRARLLTVRELHGALQAAGLRTEEEAATLFDIGAPERVETPRAGSNSGSFVAVRAAIARAGSSPGNLDRMNPASVGSAP